VTPSRMVVSTQTTRVSLTTLSLKARRARAPSWGSFSEGRTPPPCSVLSTTIRPPGRESSRAHPKYSGLFACQRHESQVERPLALDPRVGSVSGARPSRTTMWRAGRCRSHSSHSDPGFPALEHRESFASGLVIQGTKGVGPLWWEDRQGAVHVLSTSATHFRV